MNIAIIEDEVISHQILEYNIKEACDSCTIEFFIDSIDFGKANLNSFDIIIADNRLPTMSGRELLKSISQKTKASLLLLSGHDVDFLKQNVKEDFISGFVSKGDISPMIDHIKYIDAKLRINKLLDREEGRLANQIKDSGCSVEINGSIVIIGLSCELSDKEKETIRDQVTSSQYKGIVFFSDNATIGSAMMRDMIYFYKVFKDNKKKFCFWNAYKKDEVKSLLEICNLNKLIKIFDNINEAIQYLSDDNSKSS